MFEEALRKLKNSKTVKVFAPTGAWAISSPKEEWIQALCDTGKDVEFIAGRGPDEEKDSLVLERLERLQVSGVKVYETEPTPSFRLGIIIFDNCSLVGLSSTDAKELRCFETEFPSHMETLKWLFEDAKKAAKLWHK